MKITTFPVLLAAALLGFSCSLNAQTTITPSGNVLDGTWSGYYIGGSEPTSGTSSVTWTGAFPVGGVATETASFYSSNPDYALDPAWGGTFDITSTLTSGNLQYEHLLVRNPASANIGLAQNFLGDIFSTTAVVLRARTGATTGSITYDFDFSGLVNGFLPKGTSLYLIDLDSGSGTEGPLSITAGFNTQFMDYIGQAGSGQTPPSLPTVTWNSATGTYEFTQVPPQPGATGNLIDYSVFVTTEDLTTLSISSTQAGGSHGVFFGAPVVPVPEPSGLLMLGVAGASFLLNRRRTK
jgi:hypothetical protein